MIKNLSELQSNARHSNFAKRLTEALCFNNIEPTPIAFVFSFNSEHKGNLLRAHTARKWLLGETKPRQETLSALAKWLKVDPNFLMDTNETVRSAKSTLEIDFTDQEVFSKCLSMNLKQKTAVSLLIDAILEHAK